MDMESVILALAVVVHVFFWLAVWANRDYLRARSYRRSVANDRRVVFTVLTWIASFGVIGAISSAFFVGIGLCEILTGILLQKLLRAGAERVVRKTIPVLLVDPR